MIMHASRVHYKNTNQLRRMMALTHSTLGGRRVWTWFFSRWAVVAAAVLLATAVGCKPSATDSPPKGADAGAEQPNPSVTVVKPERTTLRRTVRQPGAVQAFERTPMYARIAGYVKKWNV